MFCVFCVGALSCDRRDEEPVLAGDGRPSLVPRAGLGRPAPAQESETATGSTVPIVGFEPGRVALGYDASPVGSARCGFCHPEHRRRSRTSRMARTSRRVTAESLDLWFDRERLGETVDWPSTGPSPPPRYRRDGDRVVLEAKGADGSASSATVDAIFGSGHLAFTPISAAPGRGLRELRVSRFTAGGWAMTPGSAGDPDPLGYVRSHEFSVDCLRCHTTSLAWVDDRLDLERTVFGIGCERCHGPGSEHVAAAEDSEEPGRIFNPGELAGAEQVRFCGECHRRPRDIEPDRVLRATPELARHAGASLMLSACFRRSPPGTSISCLDCHDPHGDGPHGDGPHGDGLHGDGLHGDGLHGDGLHGDGRARASERGAACLRCHVSPADDHSSPKVDRSADCVGCHMPAQKGSFFGLDFTSHWIRVPGAPAPAASPQSKDEYARYLERAYSGAIALGGWGQERQAKLRMRLGKLLFHEFDHERGLAALREALSYAPLYKDRILASRYHVRAGRVDDAVSILDDAIRVFPEHNVAYHELAELHMRARRLDAAQEVLARWERARPGDPHLQKDRRTLERLRRAPR